MKNDDQFVMPSLVSTLYLSEFGLAKLLMTHFEALLDNFGEQGLGIFKAEF